MSHEKIQEAIEAVTPTTITFGGVKWHIDSVDRAKVKNILAQINHCHHAKGGCLRVFILAKEGENI